MGHSVEVVFDQWDLDEGQDVHAYMEQAVNDPTVSHVLILCDPLYAEKANGRMGGVGKETLIVSPAVYEDVKQKRVIPIIMERDAAGKVSVPTYLDGRKFIDLSQPDKEADAYEQLLRRLLGKPARKRPPLGQPPSFLQDDYVPLRTSGTFQLFRAATMGNRPQAPGLFADYLDRLEEAYAQEELKEIPKTEAEFAEAIVASIERFRGYRNEFVEACRVVGRYSPDRAYADRLHGFFERLVTVRLMHGDVRWADVETENLEFIGWELCLYAVAVFLLEESFALVARLLSPLHVVSRGNSEGRLVGFDILQAGFPFLQRINELRQAGRRDYAAHLLRERIDDNGVTMEVLIEADLLLWYRQAGTSEWGHWYPRTLVFLGYRRTPRLFARANVPDFFEQLAPALGVHNREEFIKKFDKVKDLDFFPVGHSVGGRHIYAQLLGISQG